MSTSWLRRIAVAAGLVGSVGSLAGCAASDPPRLLLLITVDTLRADQLGAYGSSRGLTPALDAMAARSLVFETVYAPASFTLPSVAAIMTGRYPEELGIRTNESGVPESAQTLASELAGRGWRTGAVVGNFVLRRSSGLARGFERFDDDFREQEAVRGWPERSALDATDAILAMLEDCTANPRERCFLWVHYQDPHGPYTPDPERRRALLAEERRAADGTRELPQGEDHRGFGAIPDYQFLEGRHEVAYYRAGYRAEIQQVDEQVGRLLESLNRRGLDEHSVVVFTADHGESLGEHDVWFAHGALLGDEQVRVPLLLRIPGQAAGRRGDVASLVDVRPTLLGLLGAAPPPADAPGRDLLATGAEEQASAPYMATLGAADAPHYAWVEGGFKLILSTRGERVHTALHRLGDEETDLAAAAPQVTARLRRALEQARERIARGVSETPQELDDRDRERLRALGYGEGAAGS